MSTGSSSSEFEGPICISSDRKHEAKAHSLLQSLYPEFTGMEGPTDDTEPKDNSALDVLKGKVYRGQVGQKSGVLVVQSVPPLLPAYSKFMGGVDKTDQLHKYYAFDHYCK